MRPFERATSCRQPGEAQDATRPRSLSTIRDPFLARSKLADPPEPLQAPVQGIGWPRKKGGRSAGSALRLAAEWAYMTYGQCQVTVLDPQGRADAEAGELWYFPAG
jgi:hypothetical protein